MIGFNKTVQTALIVMMFVFGVILTAFQARKINLQPGHTSKHEKSIAICEILTAFSLIAVAVTSALLYISYIPSNSPGCLKYISSYGVIASAVDPSSHVPKSSPTYLANSFKDAVDVFRKSPNGLATGYFSWDGLSVTILDAEAYQLATGAPPGSSWVFQDLGTAIARSQ